MADYIDRQAIVEALTDELNNGLNIDEGRIDGLGLAIACVDKMPAADVVEVVRCRDCKHSDWYECYGLYKYQCHRFFYAHPTEMDGFCSYGERKDG